jgi:hypothetical protein
VSVRDDLQLVEDVQRVGPARTAHVQMEQQQGQLQSSAAGHTPPSSQVKSGRGEVGKARMLEGRAAGWLAYWLSGEEETPPSTLWPSQIIRITMLTRSSSGHLLTGHLICQSHNDDDPCESQRRVLNQKYLDRESQSDLFLSLS